MTAREQIFSSIRRSLAVTSREKPRCDAVNERLQTHPRGIIPARSHLAPDQRKALFIAMAQQAFCTVEPVNEVQSLPSIISNWLKQSDLPLSLVIGDDPLLTTLPWQASQISMRRGPAAPEDTASLSRAFAAIAETGTLMMVSGTENPSTNNFLPETHCVLLEASRILPDYETGWSLLRDHARNHPLPRTVNWITGPSRSADIEQTLALGAHGPCRLHIFLLEDDH